VPTGGIANAIDQSFGSFAAFKDQFSKAAIGVFGSGWAWLVDNEMKLSIETSPGHDTPVMHGKKSLLVIDVWEHAYYLKYQNRRADFVAAWWNVVNWAEVNRRFGA
jgi:Fe-Mn family superoxide dismutase